MLIYLPLSLDPVPKSVVLQIAVFEDLGMRQDARTAADVPQESHFSIDYLQSDEIVLQKIGISCRSLIYRSISFYLLFIYSTVVLESLFLFLLITETTLTQNVH